MTTTTPTNALNVVTPGRGYTQTATPAATPVLVPAPIVVGAHIAILHTSESLPAPTGHVPPLIHQRDRALAFFNFLHAPNPAHLKLNEGNTVYTALVNVAKTLLVKVVYCPGMGSSPIETIPSSIDGKLLFLQGDGNADLGPPQPVCFPASTIEEHDVAMMT